MFVSEKPVYDKNATPYKPQRCYRQLIKKEQIQSKIYIFWKLIQFSLKQHLFLHGLSPRVQNRELRNKINKRKNQGFLNQNLNQPKHLANFSPLAKWKHFNQAIKPNSKLMLCFLIFKTGVIFCCYGLLLIW